MKHSHRHEHQTLNTSRGAKTDFGGIEFILTYLIAFE